MKAHVLVVDDDPRITGLVRRILAYEGYSVAIAASGNEALTRTLERPPDLIVLDAEMPVMNARLDIVPVPICQPDAAPPTAVERACDA